MKNVLGRLVWLLTSVGAINWGLDACGWNIFSFRLFMGTAAAPGMLCFLVMPLKIVLGVAGVISLIMLCQCMKETCKTCSK